MKPASFLVFLSFAIFLAPSLGFFPTRALASPQQEYLKKKHVYNTELKAMNLVIRRALKPIQEGYGGLKSLPEAAKTLQDLLQLHQSNLSTEAYRVELENLAEEVALTKSSLKKDPSFPESAEIEFQLRQLEGMHLVEVPVVDFLRAFLEEKSLPLDFDEVRHDLGILPFPLPELAPAAAASSAESVAVAPAPCPLCKEALGVSPNEEDPKKRGVYTAPCGHQFHFKGCVDLVRNQPRGRCPVCLVRLPKPSAKPSS